MASDYDWHMFDVDQQIEVCHRGGDYYARRVGGLKEVLLTPDEFNQLREPGPDPDVMKRLEE